MKRILKSSYLAIILMFMYLPIIILILFSFNSSESLSVFQNFSLKWYEALFKQSSFIESIILSLFVALISTLSSTVIGTMAAIGISKKKQLTQKAILSVNNIPLINADVITAVALMLTFLGLSIPFGLSTLILAHISFNVPYVVITVLPRMRKIDNRLIEASIDLGASNSQTFRKIVLPILKPAIFAAMAIAFAMSFDDFIISYFSGGSQVNVSTFIYTMKRVKPYINAFGSICIFIVCLSLVCWNLLKFSNERKITIKTAILNNSYRDKRIYKLESKLNLLYHSYNCPDNNDELRCRYNSLGIIFYSHMISWIHLQNKLLINNKVLKLMTRKIIRLEEKIKKEFAWIKKKKHQFIGEINREEHINKNLRTKFPWLKRIWRPLSLGLLISSSFALLTGFYITNNNYDLSVANWSDYINPATIHEFEKENNIKIKYSVYDSNETLYNKLYTTKYDVMVPSDYMVKILAEQGQIAPIDYNKLDEVDQDFHYYKPSNKEDLDPNEPEYIDTNFEAAFDKSHNTNWLSSYKNGIAANNYHKYAYLNQGLTIKLKENNFKDDNNNFQTINNYSIPYFWGDIVMVINPRDIDWLKTHGINVNTDQKMEQDNKGHTRYKTIVENSESVSWEILWDAAKDGKKVLLNNDFKNLFMLANQINYQKNLPTNNEQLNNDYTTLKPLINSNSSYLLNDEIISEVGSGNFDFAFMYNGDAIYADQMRSTLTFTKKPKSYENIMVVPRKNGEGTNIWSDNMVVSESGNYNKWTYKFMNFLIKHSSNISLDQGYTTPIQQGMDFVRGYSDSGPVIGDYSNYDAVYTPVSKKDAGTEHYYVSPKESDGPFFYNEKLDPIMLELYNKLIASKI